MLRPCRRPGNLLGTADKFSSRSVFCGLGNPHTSSSLEFEEPNVMVMVEDMLKPTPTIDLSHITESTSPCSNSCRKVGPILFEESSVLSSMQMISSSKGSSKKSKSLESRDKDEPTALIVKKSAQSFHSSDSSLAALASIFEQIKSGFANFVQRSVSRNNSSSIVENIEHKRASASPSTHIAAANLRRLLRVGAWAVGNKVREFPAPFEQSLEHGLAGGASNCEEGSQSRLS